MRHTMDYGRCLSSEATNEHYVSWQCTVMPCMLHRTINVSLKYKTRSKKSPISNKRLAKISLFRSNFPPEFNNRRATCIQEKRVCNGCCDLQLKHAVLK